MDAPASVPNLEVMGTPVPALGFGTWQLTGDACEEGVIDALALGYRHIDTARMYENEQEVGRGLAACGIPRGDIFLTTKLWMDELGRDQVPRAAAESLQRLGSDYIDLLLIHWPNPDVPLEETIEAMDALRQAGTVRHIGVSNFTPSLVRRAREVAPILANQVEYHPFLSQNPLLRDVRDEGLMLTAYCPLARGRVMQDPTIGAIAEAHGKTPAQVTLRWLIQHGVAAIPKAASREHRRSNLDIFDFELSRDEMDRIFALGGEQRLIDPEWAPRWERGA